MLETKCHDDGVSNVFTLTFHTKPIFQIAFLWPKAASNTALQWKSESSSESVTSVRTQAGYMIVCTKTAYGSEFVNW